MKNFLLKILFLLFMFNTAIYAASSSPQPVMRHWHGKNLHKVEEYVPQEEGTTRHWHGKDLHRVETTGKGINENSQ